MTKFQKDEFITNYTTLKSSRKMAELYGCDKSTILNYAKKIGYDNSKNKEIKITNIPIDEVIQKYEELKSTEKVAEIYNCSATAVNSYLKNNNYILNNCKSKLQNVDKKQFIRNYDNLKSAKKMAKIYNCSATAILQYAKKINYNVNMNKSYKLSENDKIYVINSYNNKSSTQLSKELGVSRGMITKIWYDNKLKGKANTSVSPQYKDLTNQKIGMLTVISPTEYRSPNGNVIWLCECECGRYKNVSSDRLLQHSIFNCGCKNIQSKGNLKIQTLLKNAGIIFETEKKFDTCIDKNKLPFDFWVENSYLIEFDGSQHFKYTNYDWNTAEKFIITQKHDNIKNEWARQNHIPLIRIPYTKLNNLKLEDLLLETSKFII